MGSFHSLKFEKNIRLPVAILNLGGAAGRLATANIFYVSLSLWNTQRALGYL